MDPSVDDELIGMLKNTSLSAEARLQGWSYVISLSATTDGLRHLINSGKYLPFIVSSIYQGSDEESVKQAFKSLINISSEEQGTLAILRCQKGVCNFFLNSIVEQNSKFVDYKCSVLSNMATNPECLDQIIHILLSSKGLYEKLVAAYCSSDMRNQYDMLTLMFGNVSRLSAGRRLFLQDSRFIKNILKLTQPSESESRRLGAALILRNCCLETEYHAKLLSDFAILPALLLPLMVPQQYEEGGEMGRLPPELQERCLHEVTSRDESVSVRRVLVEALTVLCYSEAGWRFLKSNGAYYVVQALHAWETDQESKEAVEQLVAYLLVVEYSKPDTTPSESHLSQDAELVKQLESDMTKYLPDFVI